ncbi:hypothetical protein GCM10027062_31950 [Nocardioides hungaricus]
MIEAWSLGSSVLYGPLLVGIPIAILAEVGSISPCSLPLVPATAPTSWEPPAPTPEPCDPHASIERRAWHRPVRARLAPLTQRRRTTLPPRQQTPSAHDWAHPKRLKKIEARLARTALVVAVLVSGD